MPPIKKFTIHLFKRETGKWYGMFIVETFNEIPTKLQITEEGLKHYTSMDFTILVLGDELPILYI